MKEKITGIGYVEVFTRDVKTGDVTLVCAGNNVITNAGLYLTADWIANLNRTTNITHCALGTDNTAAAATQTTLESENYRKAIDFKDSGASSTAVTIETTFGVFESNGVSLNEAGLFTESSAGTMFSRFVFASPVSKTAAIEKDSFKTAFCQIHNFRG